MTAQNEVNIKIHMDPIPVYHPKIHDLVVDKPEEAQLKHVFEKYANYSVYNQKAMKTEDFIQKYLGLMSEKDYNPNTLRLLANAIDLDKNGYICFDEFKRFEEILRMPDVLFKCAFHLFDTTGSGYVSFESFKEIISSTELHNMIPFDFECEFIQNQFGKDKQRRVNYEEFTQIIHDFHEEHAVQAFRKFDKKNTGHILASNFKTILLQLKNHLLSPYLKENLADLIRETSIETHNQTQITYPFFIAFICLLNNMELVKKIYLEASDDQENRDISRGQFMRAAQQFSQVTPLEVNLLFSLVKAFRDDGKITMAEIDKISPLKENQMLYRVKAKIAEEKFNIQHRNVGLQALENAYRFFLGSIAGAVGAFAVYPIDLVKTRMQNQRTTTFVGELMYRNSADCFKKVVRHEGLMGLYKGLTVQLIGVAPEKAIKLTVNDLVRDKFNQYNGSLPLWGEVLAGGMAGMCQVIFTNPMEIVKIRMQVAGEVGAPSKRQSIGSIVKELGLFGLYKGVRACLLRDIPFSMIYFPSYAHTKKLFSDENGHNSPGSLFLAGFISGVPAAGLVTPADVIKTRLQVRQKTGETVYKGIIDAVRKINKEEGATAFWKGAGARVMRSSPQFGVTLVSYEILQRMFYIDFGGRKPEGSQVDIKHKIPDTIESLNPDHIGGFKLATVTFAGLENKFGLCFPKFKPKTQ